MPAPAKSDGVMVTTVARTDSADAAEGVAMEKDSVVVCSSARRRLGDAAETDTAEVGTPACARGGGASLRG